MTLKVIEETIHMTTDDFQRYQWKFGYESEAWDEEWNKGKDEQETENENPTNKQKKKQQKEQRKSEKDNRNKSKHRFSVQMGIDLPFIPLSK